MKYKTKPVEIEAIEWIGDEGALRRFLRCTYGFRGDIVIIETPEGFMDCPLGHFIIKGTMGEFYPCHPVAFHEKYESMVGR